MGSWKKNGFAAALIIFGAGVFALLVGFGYLLPSNPDRSYTDVSVTVENFREHGDYLDIKVKEYTVPMIAVMSGDLSSAREAFADTIQAGMQIGIAISSEYEKEDAWPEAIKIYGLEAGGRVYLTLEQSIAAAAKARKIVYSLFWVAFCTWLLAGCIVLLVLRRPESFPRVLSERLISFFSSNPGDLEEFQKSRH